MQTPRALVARSVLRIVATSRDQEKDLISCYINFVPFSFPDDPKVISLHSSILTPYACLGTGSLLCNWSCNRGVVSRCGFGCSSCFWLCFRETLLWVLPCVYFSQIQQKALCWEQKSQRNLLLIACFFFVCVWIIHCISRLKSFKWTWYSTRSPYHSSAA